MLVKFLINVFAKLLCDPAEGLRPGRNLFNRFNFVIFRTGYVFLDQSDLAGPASLAEAFRLDRFFQGPRGMHLVSLNRFHQRGLIAGLAINRVFYAS